VNAVETTLRNLGVTLPSPAAPVANYVPFVRTGNLVVVSGQLCLGLDGKLDARHKGKLGDEVSPETGQEAARLCAINLLDFMVAALGDKGRHARSTIGVSELPLDAAVEVEGMFEVQ
jgi:enamine deaminase RidA (YjgF/YER057c/UK114 family)